MSIHVCKCIHNGNEEFHLRYPGMTETEAQALADKINAGGLTGRSKLTLIKEQLDLLNAATDHLSKIVEDIGKRCEDSVQQKEAVHPLGAVVAVAPELSKRNKWRLRHTEYCGCYFCLRIFSTKDVMDWEDQGTTALCPHCNIDALLPGVTNLEVLKAAHERWFCTVSERNDDNEQSVS